MKALIFNHHPDYFWYTYSLLSSLGIECHMASKNLTFEMGADYASIDENGNLLTSGKWYSPEELFPNFSYTVSNNIDGYDYYCTTNRDIAKNLPYGNKKVIYSTVVMWDITGCNELDKYTKISSVDYIKQFGGTRITYFVPQRGELIEKKYITQLISGYRTIYYDELLRLKNTYPVIVAGDISAPDGIVNDWETLKYTSLLVHDKQYGSCCNSVMKALDCGIPIYMSKKNRYVLGFDDIPEDCFIFSDDHNIEDAYKKSLLTDNKKIQEQFRSIKNIEKAKTEVKNLLEILK